MPADVTIAVVIPTYNRGRYVELSVRSVFAQTRPADQVIVVDDGSDDDTLAVLAQLDRQRHLEVISLTHSGVPGIVRNAGVARARTSHVAFLDSDDEWLPQKLDVQERILTKNRDAVVVCGNATIVDADGADRGLYFAKEGRSPAQLVTEATIARANPIITSTALVRVDILRSISGFPTQRRLFAVEDFHTWPRLLREGYGIYSGEPVALYRRHSQGASCDRRDNAIRRLFAVRSILRSSKAEYRAGWKTVLAAQYAECAGWYQGMGRMSRARHLFVRVRQLAAFAPLRWVRAARSYLWALKRASQDRG